jgi:aspartyl aminopeptidase
VAGRLTAAGFLRLDETDPWELRAHGRYFVTRNDSTLAAFIAGGEASASSGWRLIGAHTDSPSLKLKPEPAIERHGYVQLGVEVYGGPLHNSWLDRDLGLAGRVLIAPEGPRRGARAERSRGTVAGRKARGAARGAGRGAARGEQAGAAFAPPGTLARLWRLDAPLGRIPQLAIHLDREVNEKGLVLNRESHLVPVIGLSERRGFDFCEWLGQQLGVPGERILDHDLFFHDLARPTFAGLRGEFLFAPRLDNLASSFCALSALIATRGEKTAATRLIALYDNEEIGSGTRQGADSSFLEDVLVRLAAVPGEERGRGGRAGGDRASVERGEAYIRARSRSLLVSADMAHAVHPNYADRSEARHQPRLNGGPVIKYNANARYATDAASGALFQTICREARVPFQKYVNRADLVCGSTIGPIVARRIGVPTVDVGCPQLAMHSAREMAGALDPGYMIGAMSRFLVR